MDLLVLETILVDLDQQGKVDYRVWCEPATITRLAGNAYD